MVGICMESELINDHTHDILLYYTHIRIFLTLCLLHIC